MVRHSTIVYENSIDMVHNEHNSMGAETNRNERSKRSEKYSNHFDFHTQT